jgi:hypothetical protein
VLAAVNKAQKTYKTDVFGFGFKLSIQHSKEWEAKYKDVWKDIFSDVPVNVDVQTKIINSGVVVSPIEEK